jgi:phosphoenolpyruvate carboxykinase (GTP)
MKLMRLLPENPMYADLKALFKKHLGEDFSEADYTIFLPPVHKVEQQLERAKAYYAKMDPNTPKEIYDYWDSVIAKLETALKNTATKSSPAITRAKVSFSITEYVS